MSNSRIENKITKEFSDTDQIRGIHLTGSSYTCDPPVKNTDTDVVVWVRDMMFFAGLATAKGYALDLDPNNPAEFRNYRGSGAQFVSMRKGKINLIVTPRQAYYRQYVLATELAKRFNLKNKDDRIMLFRGVIDRVWPTIEEVKGVEQDQLIGIGLPPISSSLPEVYPMTPDREPTLAFNAVTGARGLVMGLDRLTT